MNDKDQQRALEALEAIAKQLKRLDDIGIALEQIRGTLAAFVQKEIGR